MVSRAQTSRAVQPGVSHTVTSTRSTPAAAAIVELVGWSPTGRRRTATAMLRDLDAGDARARQREQLAAPRPAPPSRAAAAMRCVRDFDKIAAVGDVAVDQSACGEGPRVWRTP